MNAASTTDGFNPFESSRILMANAYDQGKTGSLKTEVKTACKDRVVEHVKSGDALVRGDYGKPAGGVLAYLGVSNYYSQQGMIDGIKDFFKRSVVGVSNEDIEKYLTLNFVKAKIEACQAFDAQDKEASALWYRKTVFVKEAATLLRSAWRDGKYTKISALQSFLDTIKAKYQDSESSEAIAVVYENCVKELLDLDDTVEKHKEPQFVTTNGKNPHQKVNNYTKANLLSVIESEGYKVRYDVDDGKPYLVVKDSANTSDEGRFPFMLPLLPANTPEKK